VECCNQYSPAFGKADNVIRLPPLPYEASVSTKDFPRHGRQGTSVADWNDRKVVHSPTSEALASVGVEHPLEELRKLVLGLETMDGPVPPHSDRGRAVKFGDFVAIDLPSFVVLAAEEIRHLAFERFRHGSPPTEARSTTSKCRGGKCDLASLPPRYAPNCNRTDAVGLWPISDMTSTMGNVRSRRHSGSAGDGATRSANDPQRTNLIGIRHMCPSNEPESHRLHDEGARNGSYKGRDNADVH